MRNKSRRHRLLISGRHVLFVAAILAFSYLYLNRSAWNLLLLAQSTKHSLDIDIVAKSDNEIDRLSQARLSFCAPWTLDVDRWWAHVPLYHIALQNATHQCFRPVTNPDQAKIYDKLYRIQFSDRHVCSRSYRKLMSNSGWAVDLSYVIDGMLHAYDKQESTVITMRGPWQYAKGVCASATLDCYFLPLSSCAADAAQEHDKVEHLYKWRGFHRPQIVFWLLEYTTRGQTWLRRDAAILAAQVKLEQPCTIVHVRRADVVLHGKFSRAYHPISEYVQAARITDHDNVLLLTDDNNAIAEAKTDYPLLNWYYIDRPRHSGAQGGWENQIPSNDPAYEATVILAILQLVPLCDCIVHTKSNLADYMYAHMGSNPQAQRIDMDAARSHHEIHSAANADTVRVSRDQE